MRPCASPTRSCSSPTSPARWSSTSARSGLATRFAAEGGSYGELDTGAVTLAIAHEDFVAEGRGLPARPTRPDDPPPAFEVALVTDDVAGAYEHAVAAGAVAVHAPAEKPWGQTVAYVRDCDGALVELASPVD